MATSRALALMLAAVIAGCGNSGSKIDSAKPVICPTCQADEVCVYAVDMLHAACTTGRAVCLPRADTCVAEALAKPGATCSDACTASLCGSSKPVCSHNPCGTAPPGTGVSVACSWP